jgi:lyso-ornithine lipid O-acyltransferase
LSGRRTRLAALLATGVLLALPVACLRRRKAGRHIVRWWFERVARALRLEIVARGQPTKEPALWCSNHVSWLDVVALGAEADLTFVSKSEVRSWPLVGWCASAAGTLFIRRGADSATGRSIARVLAQENSAAIFPEGTTGTGERLRRFHPRLFAAAIETGAFVQPVAIRFSEAGIRSSVAPFVGDDSFFPHLLKVLAHGGLRVELAFAPPIDPAALPDRRALAQAAETAVACELAKLPHLAAEASDAAGNVRIRHLAVERARRSLSLH